MREEPAQVHKKRGRKMAIEFINIEKSFGDTKALSDICLRFEEGRIYGLLGRNGAGKSTLLNILTGRIFKDSGEVLIDGISAPENDAAQGKLFMMGEANLFPENMTAKRAFSCVKDFYPGFDKDNAYKLSELFGLDIGKKINKLSTGYCSIFKIILALSVNTPYVAFDEPVLGLDANHRDLFYRILLEKYTKNPFCAVISTHLIEEIAHIIEHVVLIKSGRVIRDEDTEALLSSGYTASGPKSLVEAFTQGRNVIGKEVIGGLSCVYILGPTPARAPAGIELGKPDLQKLFIRLTD